MFLNEELDPDKCHGRADLRCQELSEGGICLPTCGSDAQCPGRSCDPTTVMCVDQPNDGKPLGAKCEVTPMGTDCAGLCIEIANDKSLCTTPCSMAGPLPDPFECGGPERGICLYSPSGTGLGDLGYCAQSCTAQDQCQTPDFFCLDIGLRSSGICLDSLPCTSNADCTFLDGECIETTLGKFCMSPDYPLGNL
jgi:hypothetical protein